MLRDLLINQLVISVEPDAKVSEAAKLMAEHNVGDVLVLTNDRPRGILTDRDIVVRCLAKNVDVNDCTVENVMSESLETSRDTDGVFDCIQKMRDARVRRMPVVDSSGKCVGIISFSDLLGFLSKELIELSKTTTPLEEAEKEERYGKAA